MYRMKLMNDKVYFVLRGHPVGYLSFNSIAAILHLTGAFQKYLESLKLLKANLACNCSLLHMCRGLKSFPSVVT